MFVLISKCSDVLRRPYATGDDPEECLLSPMGNVKKV
jgi:hypothetical protein